MSNAVPQEKSLYFLTFDAYTVAFARQNFRGREFFMTEFLNMDEDRESENIFYIFAVH